MFDSATVQILHGLNPNPDEGNVTKNDVLPRTHNYKTKVIMNTKNASGAIYRLTIFNL